jgi:uncharacterized protein (TIGR04255 family)
MLDLSKSYPNAPLEEVAFEIRFLPRLSILNRLAEFQEQLADEYPLLKEETPQQGVQEEPGNDLFERARRQLVLCTPDEQRFIRVSITMFNLVDKQYSHFPVFKDELLRTWKAFSESVGDCRALRIGLRFRNHLVLPLDTDLNSVRQYTRPYVDQSKLGGRKLLDMRTEVLLGDPDHDGNPLLMVRSGFVGTREYADGQRFLVYLLDYDAFVQFDKKVVDDFSAILLDLHSVIKDRFAEDVEDKYVSVMEEEGWNDR